MRTNEPTFWPLGGAIGWPQAPFSEGVAVNRQTSLRLATSPAGRLSLTAKSDSLGELTMPRGMTLDENGRFYLLVGTQIKRFYHDGQRFVALPTIGGEGTEARQFINPANIACAGGSLFVADAGNGRVQQFDLTSLALRRVWRLPNEGTPVDIVAHKQTVYVLDGTLGRVYVQQAEGHRIRQLINAPGKQYQRLALDRDSTLYLLNSQSNQLDIYAANGRFVKTAVDAGQVRDQFEPPAVRLDQRNNFTLPSSCQTVQANINQRFNRRGQAIPYADPSAPLDAAPYQQTGVWISPALDSEIYQCQWHKIELDVDQLPAGSRVAVYTFTADEQLEPEALSRLPETMWVPSLSVTGEMQPPPETLVPPTLSKPEVALIQSGEGQYCWVRLNLSSDGYDTPILSGLSVHYPRHSYAAFLPAVFSEEDESRSYLTRYLSIVEAEWGSIEKSLDTMAQYFDPKAVPDGAPLHYLADWLALPLEGAWNDVQKRRLLTQMPALYPKRGTAVALRQYVQTYLENMNEPSTEWHGEFPKLIEGFRARRYMKLLDGKNGTLSRQVPLWGPSKVGRLQTDVFAEVGEVRLVSLGDPQTEIFDQYAHRFRIFMPSVWIRSKQDEAMIRRAIETEKPAHTDYDLQLVDARFRVGIQSTVGIDTIIGGLPKAKLMPTLFKETRAPSAPIQHQLGVDMIL